MSASGRLAVRTLAGETEAAVCFVDVAGTFQTGEQLWQRAAAPVAELERGPNFANALRAIGCSEMGEEASFIDFFGA